jgi:formylglycine-generating enzyme required for sulfatase activity
MADAPRHPVALVIGNGSYRFAPQLANPPSDASAMAKALRGLGFEVIEGIDLDRTGFVDRLRKFSHMADGADLAILYYAGHGLQVDNQNWLVPVDAELKDRLSLEYEAVSLDSIVRAITAARARILILDACRDDPFSRNILGPSRSLTTRGLAPVDVVDGGTLIAFATSPGAVASDGDRLTGNDSPFTAALLKNIAVPGLEIRQMFTRVRQSVVAQTKGTQVPWENSSLLTDIYIAGPPVEVPQKPSEADAETEYWRSIQGSSNPALFAEYIEKFPSSVFTPLARERLKEMNEPKAVAPPVFRDCATCPEMVKIPVGSLTIAETGGQARPADVGAFAMGRFATTFEEWDACVAEKACHTNPSDAGYGRGRRPVINVSWDDSAEFLAWLSKKAGHTYRLPTEIEWEYAARAGTRTARFWGDDPAAACRFANVYDNSKRKAMKLSWSAHNCDGGYVHTAPVGSFQPNAFGLYDMIGNVWQWTSDCWGDVHQSALDTPETRRSPNACSTRVLRGGSFMSDPANAEVTSRMRGEPSDSDVNMGFRVVRALDEPGP